jgi:ribosome-binding factor A
MSQRMLRVNELLKEEIASFLQKQLPDAKFGFTVYQVICTPDLRQAKVYLSPLGDSIQSPGSFFSKINRELHQHLSKRLKLKFIPRLKFIWQDSAEMDRIEKLLKQIELRNTK